MPASRRTPVRPSPRVAVLIEASNAYGRGLLEGIRRHLREREPWTILLPEHGRGMPPLEMLARWTGEGIIARIETPEIAAAIAQLAADHFIERDFRHLAFLGDERFRWSGNRRDAFVAAACDRSVAVYRSPGRGGHGTAEDEAIEAWLVSLPKPAGLFACYDVRGRQAVEICRRAGLAVPDEVAVLGLDDDAVLCGLSSPPLSSVIPDAIGAGRLAAELLEAMLRGERLEGDEWLLPPVGIATRQSTDVLAIAALAGFRHPEYMTVAFTRRHGISPSHWRRARSVSVNTGMQPSRKPVADAPR